MIQITVIDRQTKKEEIEKVYGQLFLQLLYNDSLFAKILSRFVANTSIISHLFGWIQKLSFSKRNIKSFIDKYEIDIKEFLEPIESFHSFNDFFIRKLKPECRPIDTDPKKAILPADGRYLVYPDLNQISSFTVKGKSFNLENLFEDTTLVEKYKRGALLIARLTPVDYHRFHFPCDGIPSKSGLINGPLYSVNPIALKKNIAILSQNKRVMTLLKTELFGDVMFVEVGATGVGSIKQTYTPNVFYKKGDEKGYFEFGGSSILVLFEEKKIQFDGDLIDASNRGMEIRAKMGQSMGSSLQIGQTRES